MISSRKGEEENVEDINKDHKLISVVLAASLIALGIISLTGSIITFMLCKYMKKRKRPHNIEAGIRKRIDSFQRARQGPSGLRLKTTR